MVTVRVPLREQRDASYNILIGSGLVREPPVGHYFDPDEPTLEATVASLNDTGLVYPPGTKTKYSNAGIAVVGRLLEMGVATKEDIQRAMLAQIRNGRNEPPTWTPGSDGSSSGSSSKGSKGLIIRAIEWLGPSNAGAVPLPLLILAGVAFLLLAAAGGSYISRWIQQRRLPPPQSALLATRPKGTTPAVRW